jgi:UDP-2,3-diacylglucosamine hydrolase
MNEVQKHPDSQPGSATGPVADSAGEPTVIFVSDSHFHREPDADEIVRLEHFCQLLDLACEVDQLVLLGDIFDFWFDYPNFRLKGFEALLQALDKVRDAGTKIHFIGGNHDIWAASYFHERYGSSRDGESETLQLGRRRVRLSHGDGLLKFDWAYNGFRAMVRTRLGIVLAKSLHPELLYSLSTWLSGHSRGANRDEASEIEKNAHRWFAKQTEPTADREPDWDLMITGHVHHGVVIDGPSRQFVALAGWFEPLSYGLLQNGQFQLLDFLRDPRPSFDK